MMIMLERLTWGSTGSATTSPFAINPKNVVSMSPARKLLSEVNGSPVDGLSVTEINYSIGTEVEKVFVVGEYNQVVNKILNKKSILYG